MVRLGCWLEGVLCVVRGVAAFVAGGGVVVVLWHSELWQGSGYCSRLVVAISRSWRTRMYAFVLVVVVVVKRERSVE